MQLITRLSNYGVKEKECKGIKFVIEKPKFKNETTEHLTPGQVKKLVTAIHEDTNPIARMMELALFTGCRRGELLKLRWSDIDFDHSFIVLKDLKGGGDDSLKIPMSPSVREILRSIPRGESEYVFPNDDGAIRAQLYHVVNRIKKKVGLPKEFRGFHGLRHAYASMLVSNGTPLYVVQNLLGHRDIRMTSRYSHLADETLRDAANHAESLIKQAIQLPDTEEAGKKTS